MRYTELVLYLTTTLNKRLYKIMKKTLPRKLVFLTVLLGGSAALSACGEGQASVTTAAEAETPVPVETTTPHRSDIYATYAASASIDSDADAPVTARVAGEVVELLVEEGDFVAAGQVLARIDGERLRLEMLAAKANLQRASKDYERNTDLHRRGLISTSMYEGLKYDLESLRATYELKRLNFDYSNIRATIPGIVAARMVKSGENLNIGQVAFRITDTSELIAHLQIPQVELARINAGQEAMLEVAAMPGKRFAATITRISPTIDMRNGTFRATATIDNSSGELAPGMFAQFAIKYAQHANALLIPSQALLDEDNETAVYVVQNGEVSRRTVSTGIENRGRVEILDGLQEDEQIIVIGHAGLREGSKVLASLAEPGYYTG